MIDLLTIDPEAAAELAALIEAEADHWEDDRGDPGTSVEDARAIADQLRRPGLFKVRVYSP